MQINKLILIVISVFLLITNTCFAKKITKNIDKVINDSKINKAAISISIKSLDTKKIYYEHNSCLPMPPASTQKIITTIPAIKILGDNYKFETKIYKNNQNDYLIVLGADPYLTTADLRKLTAKMPNEIKNIYIDDSIIDKTEWGEGWQWDDEINPLMPKFSAYNIDRNTTNIIIEPTKPDVPANFVFEKDYPINFVNQIVTGNTNDFIIEKITTEDLDVISGRGIINKTAIAQIPVNSPKKYFKLRLIDVLLDNEVSNNNEFKNIPLTQNYVLFNTISHDIALAKEDIIKNSDNFVAETTFKLAGGKYKKTKGTFASGLEMFDDYCKQMNLDNSLINIVDASGVSKNNLMIADFMTDFLIINKQDLIQLLPAPGEGTLSDRLLYLKNNLNAKTGSLTNVSALAGYVSTQNGHKYVFSIMINDAKSKPRDKKILEDNIIKILYLKG